MKLWYVLEDRSNRWEFTTYCVEKALREEPSLRKPLQAEIGQLLGEHQLALAFHETTNPRTVKERLKVLQEIVETTGAK